MENKTASYEEADFSFGEQITKTDPVVISGFGVGFPGDLDRGTPLVKKENDRHTIIGKNICIINY